MALEIVWTKRAEAGYAKIIEYLETHFTEKEIRKFVRQSHGFLSCSASILKYSRVPKSKNMFTVGRLISSQSYLSDQATKEANRTDQYPLFQAKTFELTPSHEIQPNALRPISRKFNIV